MEPEDSITARAVAGAEDLEGSIDSVVQSCPNVTTGNEYRINFRLTKTLPGGGTVQEMPGAHSDVGGGYRDPGQVTELTPPDTRGFDSRAAAEAAREQAIRIGANNRGLFERDWRAPVRSR